MIQLKTAEWIVHLRLSHIGCLRSKWIGIISHTTICHLLKYKYWEYFHLRELVFRHTVDPFEAANGLDNDGCCHI